MAEELEHTYVNLRDKQYVIPEELVTAMPVHYANHVEVNITSEEVALIFCSKLELLTTNSTSNVAIPQGCFFMSIAQAEGLATLLQNSIGDMKKFLKSKAEEEKANV